MRSSDELESEKLVLQKMADQIGSQEHSEELAIGELTLSYAL